MSERIYFGDQWVEPILNADGGGVRCYDGVHRRTVDTVAEAAQLLAARYAYARGAEYSPSIAESRAAAMRAAWSGEQS